jgi:hypothetical protein
MVISDLVNPVMLLLGNRTDVATLAVQEIADAITEITDNYPFEELRESGPVVQFTPGVNSYNSTFFIQPATGGNPQHVFNKVISWFFYLQPPVNLATNPNIGFANPGYSLRFRDVEDLEVLLNTISLPQFWTQIGTTDAVGNAQLIVGATPQQSFFTYMRYQFKQTFTSPVALASDPILVDILWKDIFQYAAAERIALQLRMQDVADRYHTKIFGDPEFERSSGGKGQPGLIARRISQTQKNQSRSTRSVRMMGRGVY